MGLPTPNIFTGGHNYHGKFEYISVDNMIKAANVIIEIVKLVEADNVCIKKGLIRFEVRFRNPFR